MTDMEITDQDKELLGYIAEGRSNIWIARKKFLHVRTIGHRVGILLVKLNAQNRTNLVSIAYKEGHLS